MRQSKFIHWAVVLAVTFTTALPSWAFAAEQPAAKPAALPKLVIRDIAMDASGTVHGTLSNSQGQPRTGTEVVVRKGGELLTKTTSEADGRFAIRNLKPGIYEINTARSYGLYRVWAPGSEPPAAQKAALIVEGDTVIRAQEWSAWRRTLILGGVIITSGVIGGVIGYNIKDDAS